ncbi:hypothetical protein G6K93_22095 [Agrobacterium rhizogenes]|uniref:hypothetical protein n=1 Tax=Rhizobium rhizogenes TaxID=359 RepID=UPI00115E2D51|nr:hypothetical protein [Rhizobium rhizogenes]NTG05273.1 hypothetical protein [Rhizobium rhizogenes]NTG11859.1 hypothetical protein [Rhizobium rhizogenes]NTG16363.1 hypothetical protein [Rhizobium rhizogenes]NTG23304.1 hypothetical protein [Rhizobium rhizogenes]NTG32399.1 hypothetical protein [Rhizobium rhizogenes]
MPTVRIVSNIAEPQKRREIARRLTVVFGRSGVKISHLLFVWQHVELSDVYPGPFSLVDRSPSIEGNFASVTIEVSQKRSKEWRRELLQKTREIFADGLSDEYIFLGLVAVDPDNFLNATSENSRRQEVY